MKKALKSIRKSLVTPKGDYGSTNSDTQALMSAVDCEDDAVSTSDAIPILESTFFDLELSILQILLSKPSGKKYLIDKITKTFDSDKEVTKERCDHDLCAADFKGYDFLAATKQERDILEDLMLQYGLRDCGLA